MDGRGLRSVPCQPRRAGKMGDTQNKMTVTYQKELFFTLMPELPELFLQEYEEAEIDKERNKLDPDWKRYVELEIAHIFHIQTARADGKLIGYFFNFIHRHLHFSNLLCAAVDTFYLVPEYRKGRTGIKFFTENEKMLKDIGAQKISLAFPMLAGLESLMKRLKYQEAERIFWKYL